MKWLLLVLAIYVLYRLFMNDRKKKSRDSVKEKEQMVATGELVKDPVCGAYISPDSSVSVRDGETVHRFCSYECRDKFLRSTGHLPEGTLENENDEEK